MAETDSGVDVEQVFTNEAWRQLTSEDVVTFARSKPYVVAQEGLVVDKRHQTAIRAAVRLLEHPNISDRMPEHVAMYLNVLWDCRIALGVLAAVTGRGPNFRRPSPAEAVVLVTGHAGQTYVRPSLARGVTDVPNVERKLEAVADHYSREFEACMSQGTVDVGFVPSAGGSGRRRPNSRPALRVTAGLYAAMALWFLRAVEVRPRVALCMHCQTPFLPRRSSAKYCSLACRVAEHRERARSSGANRPRKGAVARVQRNAADAGGRPASSDAKPKVTRSRSATTTVSPATDDTREARTTENPDNPAVSLPSADLVQALSVSYAAATAAAALPPTLNNVLLELSEGKLRVAALDGFRGAWRTLAVSTATPRKFMLPSGAVPQLLKLLELGDTATLWWPPSDEVRDGGNKSRMLCRVGHNDARFDGAPGEFPDYERVLPSTMALTFSVERLALLRALLKVRSRGHDSDLHRVGVEIQQVGIVLSVTSETGAITRREVAIDRSEGPNTVPGCSAAVNGKYLKEALDNLVGARVRLHVSVAPHRMWLLTEADEPLLDRDSAAYIVTQDF